MEFATTPPSSFEIVKATRGYVVYPGRFSELSYTAERPFYAFDNLADALKFITEHFTGPLPQGDAK